MLAVVKKHHTDSPLFEVKGEIPKDILNYLKDKYPEDIEITEGKDESVNLFDSDWFLNIGASITTGETVKIYRENNNLTQAQLGEKLGNFTSPSFDFSDNKLFKNNQIRTICPWCWHYRFFILN